MGQRKQALNQESRPGEEGKGQRDFTDHQHSLEPSVCPACSHASAALSEIGDKRTSGHADGR